MWKKSSFSDKIANYLCLGIVVFFTILSLFRLYPFSETTPGISNEIDDWFRYWDNGNDIVKNGILIPSQKGEYYGPGSFLYNYFIATCILVFGKNDSTIYLIHSILLSSSIVIIYQSFKHKLSSFSGIALLLTLSVFGYLDVLKNYSFKLLSENLALFLVALFVYFVSVFFQHKRILHLYLAGIFLVLNILTRLTLLPFAFVFLALIFIYFIKTKSITLKKMIPLLLLVLFGISIIAFRNYLVCGKWTFLPTEGMSDAYSQSGEFTLINVAKKTLYSFGYLKILNQDYQIRPHWFLLWFAYFFYLYQKIKNYKNIPFDELIFNVFIIVIYALNLVFVTVTSYGFRAYLPAIFLLIALSFIELDKLRIFHKLR
ncbi:MAG: hypothetical protein EBQ94_13450 [Flavobacteriales bacterium]|nr:hypothetical protein [Flavobacteriales bacterium]NCA21820.1 hypothetical protein [Crocinitomicaceae bacterium]